MIWYEVGKFFLHATLVIFGSLVLQPLLMEHPRVELVWGGMVGMVVAFCLSLYCLKKGEGEK